MFILSQAYEGLLLRMGETGNDGAAAVPLVATFPLDIRPHFRYIGASESRSVKDAFGRG